LALFALALRFYLPFGHLHPEYFYGHANASLSEAVQIALPAAGSGKLLAADQAAIQPGNICTVCAKRRLLGSSPVPTVPHVLSVTLVSEPARHFIRVAGFFIGPRSAPFQSRAPPIA
jgi:hypothetical protein